MSIEFAYLLSIIFFTIFLRVLELIKSNNNKIQRIKKYNSSEIFERFYFLFVILHSTFLISVPLEVYFLEREFNYYNGFFFSILYFICILIRIHILKILGISWNTKLLVDQREDSIVTEGIYKFIRHPNYLIVIIEITSISLVHSAFYSFLIFSLINFILLYFRIRKEENYLFQNSKYYKHFKNKKRFIPGIF
jgi:methyltransferase